MLSGIDSFSGIHDFTESHLESLKNYFLLPHGAPSHDTYQRFWDALSPHQFLESFHAFTLSLKKMAGEVISIDGKTIRNSGIDKPFHIVIAWCQSNQLVLAQEKVASKSNEITAIPKLLKLLDLQDRVVTIDAMGAQREICQQIIDQNGEYVISLKGNQGTLYEDVCSFLADTDHHEDTNENNDKGHGRLEQRTAAVSSMVDWLKKEHEWPGLSAVGMVTAKVLRKEKETIETRFYISSFAISARKLNEVARAHWGIENQLHWRLDVVFNEDKACIRNDNASENMDIMRKWALNILSKTKKKPDQSIKGLMRKNAMSFKHLISSVKEIFHA
jgi:predicted transposase YbfD/YdcC